MKHTHARIQDANGSSLKGYVTTTFNKLVEAFGEPIFHIGPTKWEKVTIEWVLKFEDGTIATIYDWKGYGYQPAPDEKYEWHVGGHNSTAVELVKQELVNQESQIQFSGPFFELAK